MEEQQNIQAINSAPMTRWTRLELKQGQFEHVTVEKTLVDSYPIDRINQEIR